MPGPSVYYCATCRCDLEREAGSCPGCGADLVPLVPLVAEGIISAMNAAGQAIVRALGSLSLPAMPGMPPLPAFCGVAEPVTLQARIPRVGSPHQALFRQAEGEPSPEPAASGRDEPEPAPASDPFRKLEPDELTPEELTDYLSVERVATVLHCTPEAVNLMCGRQETKELLQPIKSGNRWVFLARNVRRYQLWAQEQNEQRRRGRPRAVGRIIPPFEESPER